MSKKRRAVITGMGAITPFGVGVAPFASALRAGQSGIRLLQQLDVTGLPTKGGGEVLVDLPRVSGMTSTTPRMVQFAAVALQEAWEQAGLSQWLADADSPSRRQERSERIGVLLGTSRGMVRELEMACTLLKQKGLSGLLAEGQELLATLFPTFGAATLGQRIAQQIGAHGPVGTISAACASGTISIGEGARWIEEGRCEVVIVGGAEAPFTPTSFAGVCSSKAMAEEWDDPTRASRPFDRTRNGYVMGEGAGVLVLESEAFARARGARMLAKVIGYTQTADASHITVPTGEGLQQAITWALGEAQISPQELDYINAHGTSTRLNDKWETWAVKQALGASASHIPISSTKSMTGHMLGAAGAVETIACLIAMQEQFIPPTINYREPDPECDLDYVPNQAREARLHKVMTQSLGFGGHNAVLVLSKE